MSLQVFHPFLSLKHLREVPLMIHNEIYPLRLWTPQPTIIQVRGEAYMSTMERLKKLFIDKFDFNVEELRPLTTLEYLGLDSLDKIEFMFDIENEFGITIPDQEFKVTTIQDIVDAVDRFVSEQKSGTFNPAVSNRKQA
jgi:acyl carrier protein